MRRDPLRWPAVALLAGLSLPAAAPATLWRLDPGAQTPMSEAPDQPVPVGSLLKPFLAKAWASTHAGAATPRYLCGPADTCWFREGHGELGLAGALTVSCNTYFVRLAEATPGPALAATLEAEGFPAIRSVRQAMGLDGPRGLLRVAPSVLLRAYVRLVREPWPGAEPVRREVLAGLREAALTGTAAGLAHRGFWAKTGTVPGPEGGSIGLALAVDDAGWAILAQASGSGAGAAESLAAPIDRFRPWAPRLAPRAGAAVQRRPGAAPQRLPGAAIQPRPMAWSDPRAVVRVRLFELLKGRQFRVRNLGPDPLPCTGGFLGPAAWRELPPGIRVGPGLIAVQDPGSGLERHFLGEIECVGPVGAGPLRLDGPGPLRLDGAGPLRRPDAGHLIARMAPREYVSGVIAAELPGARTQLSLELGAAVLRFLAQGPRYPDAEVGDSTRSAYFVGRGPRPRGSRRRFQGAGEPPDPGLSEGEWARICALARQPGPSQWSSDDGGRPLSAREVWGGAAPGPAAAPRPASRPWTRTWSAAQLEQAFAAPVQAMAVGREGGVWVLVVRTPGRRARYRYDQAHRMLAAVLGWGALPSPADSVEAVPGGFRAVGVGLGHRVGLSLGQRP